MDLTNKISGANQVLDAISPRRGMNQPVNQQRPQAPRMNPRTAPTVRPMNRMSQAGQIGGGANEILSSIMRARNQSGQVRPPQNLQQPATPRTPQAQLDFSKSMNPMLADYARQGMSAGQDMSWMQRPGAISPQYLGQNPAPNPYAMSTGAGEEQGQLQGSPDTARMQFMQNMLSQARPQLGANSNFGNRLSSFQSELQRRKPPQL